MIVSDFRVVWWIGTILRVAVISLAVWKMDSPPSLGFLGSLDEYGAFPWTAYIANGGSRDAFPYGYLLVLPFGFLISLATVVGSVIGAELVLAFIAFGCEAATLWLLLKIEVEHRLRVAAAFWLFPVPFVLVYCAGDVDAGLVPLLVAGLYFIRQRRYSCAAVLLGAAMSIKPALLILAPVVGIYFYGRVQRRDMTPQVVALMLSAFTLATLPFLFIPAFREMVFGAPEAYEFLTVSVTTTPKLNIFLFPIAYLCLLFMVWRIHRLDFDMLWAICGLGIMLGLVLAPRSPGWTVLALPFLAVHAGRSGTSGLFLFAAFSLIVAAFHLLGLLQVRATDLFPLNVVESVLATLILTCAAALAIQLGRRSILRSSFYQTMRRPIAIGVSGDSGAGKDTLVESAINIIGQRSVAHVSGDDYHLWDRAKPIWKALTHLDPRANDLARFEHDIAKLIDRRHIDAPHYDHDKGRMTRPVRTEPAEFVLASGLHSLWSPSLCALFDVRIFLDMDEDLRRFLKVRRDTVSRGHSIERVLDAIQRRAEDRERFVQPQRAMADIVLQLEPLHRDSVLDFSRDTQPPLRLSVAARPGITFGALVPLLTAISPCLVIESRDADGWLVLQVEGEPTEFEVNAVAARLAPELGAFLHPDPRWSPGLQGVLQLLVVGQIDRVRLSRWTAE